MSYAGRDPPNIRGLHSLKVDNISFRTSPEDLRRIFEKYGEIGDIHIPRDRYTRQSRGFGFVRFMNKEDAEYALDRTDGKNVDGRDLRIAFARYERPIDERGREKPRGRPRSRSRSRGGSRSRSRSRTRSRSRSAPPRRRRSRSSSRSRSRSATPAEKRRSATPETKPSPRSASRSRSRSRD